MSEDAKMWDALNCLPDAVEHMIHGDPDEADSVKASDAVKWAIAEIARLREERKMWCTVDGYPGKFEAQPLPPGPDNKESSDVPIQK